MREAWLNYLSGFPHQSLYFRSSSQYENQRAVVNGRTTGSDINFYKLFTEQCYNLLRTGGECGIVIPSGIYTDLGATGLRKMLFEQTQITGLFGFENRKAIFEGVHRQFKFVVLTFAKDNSTKIFTATFMRHDVAELANFPNENGLRISVNLIERLSPGSLSIMEFNQVIDMQIADKMLQYPPLNEEIQSVWNFVLTNEFHMRNSSHLFQTNAQKNHLPLFTGKMFHQFTLTNEHSGYWIDEKAGRESLLGKTTDMGQPLDYQGYRWVHRRIASSTNERTFIATITPKNTFTEVNSTTIKVLETDIKNSEMLFLCGITNSFVLDWYLRQKVTTTLNMFYIYQLPVPRLTQKAPAFSPIVERAAKLICTTPEFDELAAEVGLGNHHNGVTDEVERAKLRAELDGMIAHIYGLTETEFKHVLSTFPLVADDVKDATLAEYRRLAPDPELISLINDGEGPQVEFKEAARRNPHTGRDGGQKISDNILKAVAGFMNSETGGTLLIGVADDGSVTGVEVEYDIVNKAKPTWDSYSLFLENLLRNSLSLANPFQYFRLFQHTQADKTICRIQVHPAPEPVYVNNKLYVRAGNQTAELQGPELVAYVKDRWG